MIVFLTMTAVALTSLPAPKWSTNSSQYGFSVWQGPAPRAYTNKVDAGFPRTGVSNFQFTVRVPTNTNYFAVTARFKTNDLESDFSNELSIHTFTNAVLAWFWQIPPSPPKTNVVTISSGTNGIALTNPSSASQDWRLRGTNYSSMALEFALDPKGPWMTKTTWNFAGFQVPILSITKTNLP